jgi:DnaA family protein
VCQLLMQIGRLAAGAADQTPVSDRFVYLWGDDSAGKSHLLRALAQAGHGRYIGADASSAAFDYDPAVPLYLIDDCEQLSSEAQIDAFNLFNRIREQAGFLVSAGDSAPAQLKVREDLRTRLGWGLIYQVQGLSDEEKIDALSQAAAARGMILSPGLLPYLITHFRRDMRSLSVMLDALDRYSLETQRPITLPLLRSLLQMEIQERTL